MYFISITLLMSDVDDYKKLNKRRVITGEIEDDDNDHGDVTPEQDENMRKLVEDFSGEPSPSRR
jgi:hypothetical protein